jgi:hypothetical protein
MLHLNFPSQFSNSIHEILSLSMDDLLHVLQLRFHLLILSLYLLNLLALNLQLLLLTIEVFLKS